MRDAAMHSGRVPCYFLFGLIATLSPIPLCIIYSIWGEGVCVVVCVLYVCVSISEPVCVCVNHIIVYALYNLI